MLAVIAGIIVGADDKNKGGHGVGDGHSMNYGGLNDTAAELLDTNWSDLPIIWILWCYEMPFLSCKKLKAPVAALFTGELSTHRRATYRYEEFDLPVSPRVDFLSPFAAWPAWPTLITIRLLDGGGTHHR